MPDQSLTECYNCGSTERAIVCKRLCTGCYYKDKIRLRFDPKPKPPKPEWPKEKRKKLRELRTKYRLSYKQLGIIFGVSGTQVKKALRRYRIKVKRGRPKGKLCPNKISEILRISKAEMSTNSPA